MTSLPFGAITPVNSSIGKDINAGIPKDILLFGATLLENTFEKAMAEVLDKGEEEVQVPETGPSIIRSDTGEQGVNDSETDISNPSKRENEDLKQRSVKQLNKLEENVSVLTDLQKNIQELEDEDKDEEFQLDEATEVIKTSLPSLQTQEGISSSKNGELEALKSHVTHLQEEVAKKQEELKKAQEREHKAAQDNTRLQAQISNAKTYGDHHANMIQKLRKEISMLQDRNKTLEKQSLQRDLSAKKTQIEQQVAQESHQKLQERIRDLEEKVIKVNEEKQKLKADYDEAVKALEAVDQVYKVRETTLEKYKADFEEATDRLKESEREVARLKSDLSKNKDKLTRALEYKSDREELKDQLRRSKEAKMTQMEETEQVRKDLEEERHQLKMAQSRAQERGRKIEMLNLELTEVKDTLGVARNVIEEKQKNMTSIKESLDAEKHKNSKLEKEVEILTHVQKKLEYVQEEKHTLECKLKLTEVDLRETQTSLENTNIKRKELEQRLENLGKEKIHLNLQLERKGSEAKELKEIIDQKDDELEDKLMEIVQANNSIDDLRDQLEDVLMSYQNDREWWKQKADRSLGRRPKSAPPKREPARGTLSLSKRRLMKKMGTPGLNQTFLNSQHKIAWQRPPPTGQEQTPKLTTPENGNFRDAPLQQTSPSNSSGENGVEHHKFLEVSPSPPSVPLSGRPRPKRPVSSYGIRTYPQPSWLADDLERGLGYYSDMEAVIEDSRYHDYNTDNEATVATCAVHKGDKVMIQSQITGEEKMNVTGMVKYVGRIGREEGGSVFVGLKLDQPVGDTNGRFGRKQYFHCLPRHGKMVKSSDIHAIMNPRTRNFTRIRPMTVDF